MYSQAPVLARALETNPDAICHANPLRVKSSALKTQLEKQTKNKQTDEYKQVKKNKTTTTPHFILNDIPWSFSCDFLQQKAN